MIQNLLFIDSHPKENGTFYIFQTATEIVISLVGLILNFAMLLMIFTIEALWRIPGTRCIISVYLSSFMGMLVALYRAVAWDLAQVDNAQMCLVLETFFEYFFVASIYSRLIVAFDRLIYILNALKYDNVMTPTIIHFLNVVTWTFSLALAVTSRMMRINRKTQAPCDMIRSNRWVELVCMLLVYGFPGLTLVGIHSIVFHNAYTQVKVMYSRDAYLKLLRDKHEPDEFESDLNSGSMASSSRIRPFGFRRRVDTDTTDTNRFQLESGPGQFVDGCKQLRCCGRRSNSTSDSSDRSYDFQSTFEMGSITTLTDSSHNILGLSGTDRKSIEASRKVKHGQFLSPSGSQTDLHRMARDASLPYLPGFPARSPRPSILIRDSAFPVSRTPKAKTVSLFISPNDPEGNTVDGIGRNTLLLSKDAPMKDGGEIEHAGTAIRETSSLHPIKSDENLTIPVSNKESCDFARWHQASIASSYTPQPAIQRSRRRLRKDSRTQTTSVIALAELNLVTETNSPADGIVRSPIIRHYKSGPSPSPSLCKGCCAALSCSQPPPDRDSEQPRGSWPSPSLESVADFKSSLPTTSFVGLKCRVLKISLVIVLLIVCNVGLWLPFALVDTAKAFLGLDVPWSLKMTLRNLGMLSSVLDPLVFGFMNIAFRQVAAKKVQRYVRRASIRIRVSYQRRATRIFSSYFD